MPSLADFERDYWAPDREEVLAQMRAEQQQQAPPSSFAAPPYYADGGYHTQEYTPQQAEYDRFAQDYWAPDREQVLQSMRPGQFGGDHGPVYMGPGGSFQGGGWGYGGPGAFDESALEQAWLSSGGRTPQDLANFFKNNPQLVAGAQLVGSKKDKIQLPNGTVIDAVLASGEGGRGAQWLREGGGGGSSSGGGQSGGTSYGRAPNPTPFNFGKFERPGEFQFEDFQAPTPFKGPEWQAPTDVGEHNDPGYEARLREGQKAIERSAAARGTLLTGGTLKDLGNYAQEYAANEYQNVYNRAFQDYSTNYQRQANEYNQAAEAAYRDYVTSRQNAFGNYQTNWENALNAYKTNFDTQFQPWQANYQQAYNSWLGNYNAEQQGFQNQLAKENQRYQQLYGLAGLGLQATGQQAGYGQGYANNMANLYGGFGNSMGDLITGQGNANAAGQVGSANAWGGAFGNMANLAQMYGMYGMLNKSTTKGMTEWDPNAALQDWHPTNVTRGGSINAN